MKRARRGVSLEIRPGPIAFDRVAPLRYLPLQLYFRLHCRLGQVDLHAVSGRFDVADVHLARERRGPEAGDWTTTGIQREVFVVTLFTLVIPAWRHHPCVLAFEVSF